MFSRGMGLLTDPSYRNWGIGKSQCLLCPNLDLSVPRCQRERQEEESLTKQALQEAGVRKM